MLLCLFGAEDNGPISTSGAQYAKLEDARPKHWWPLCCRRERVQRPAFEGSPREGNMDTTTLLIIILVVLVLFGGGWYGRGRWRR